MLRRAQGEKITDPVTHANRTTGRGPFAVVKEHDQWGAYAPHYTTRASFGSVDGVRWYNNCGPTAVTNLLVMAGRRYPSAGCPEDHLALYARAARYGTRHLIYANLSRGPVKGTSDLRAGTWLRRMFAQLTGVRPVVRFRRASERNLREYLDRGSLLYLVLHGHPAYRNHHLVGYGYTAVKSETTGEVRTYLKVSDGHSPAPRYLDLASCRLTLPVCYEISFPELTEKPQPQKAAPPVGPDIPETSPEQQRDGGQEDRSS